MNRLALLTIVGFALGGGIAAAQPPAPKPAGHAAHQPEKSAPKPKPPTGHGMKGHGMMGGGMMEGGGTMGMCPGMMGEGNVEVTKTAKGVTITITSDDPKVVARVQKRAEAMKLMHEAQAQP